MKGGGGGGRENCWGEVVMAGEVVKSMEEVDWWLGF